jgi:hypothetical protein
MVSFVRVLNVSGLRCKLVAVVNEVHYEGWG